MKKIAGRLFFAGLLLLAPAGSWAESAEEIFARGFAFYEKGQYDQAREQFESAVRLRDDYPDAHFNLGIVAWRQWRFEPAVEHFTRLLAIAPDSEMAPDARRAIGVLEEMAIRQAFLVAVRDYETGQHAAAREGFERVLRQRPDYTEVYFNLAVLYWTQKNFELSRDNFERVIRLAPGSEMARQARESIEIFLFEGYL